MFFNDVRIYGLSVCKPSYLQASFNILSVNLSSLVVSPTFTSSSISYTFIREFL